MIGFPTNIRVRRVAQIVGVYFETLRMWVRTLNLPEEIREKIAAREVQRVPRGKIDYQTALRTEESIE